MGRQLAGRGLSPLVLSAAQLTVATGLLVLVTPLAGLQPVQLTPAVLAAISILGVLGTGVLGTGAAYVLNYRLITDEGATATSTVTYLLPVVAVVLGIVFLGEPAAAHLLIGTGIVLVGIALVQRRTPAPVS
jgi:drug/metabolite transporter (DMT)-like permease